MEYNRKAGEPIYPARQLAMFEKGDKAKTMRRRREEDSSDEEEPCQLVCNMTGSKWESLPYPIIVDSGACASVMPISWCDHVPLKETPQSQAGEFFRAANGQKIHNHGEKSRIDDNQGGCEKGHAFHSLRREQGLRVCVPDVPYRPSCGV